MHKILKNIFYKKFNGLIYTAVLPNNTKNLIKPRLFRTKQTADKKIAEIHKHKLKARKIKVKNGYNVYFN